MFHQYIYTNCYMQYKKCNFYIYVIDEKQPI